MNKDLTQSKHKNKLQLFHVELNCRSEECPHTQLQLIDDKRNNN